MFTEAEWLRDVKDHARFQRALERVGVGVGERGFRSVSMHFRAFMEVSDAIW